LLTIIITVIHPTGATIMIIIPLFRLVLVSDLLQLTTILTGHTHMDGAVTAGTILIHITVIHRIIIIHHIMATILATTIHLIITDIIQVTIHIIKHALTIFRE
jgi:hypothetical protein